MTTSPARSPRLLLIATVVLVVAGVILLTVPQTASAPAVSAPPRATAPTARPTATAPGSRAAPASALAQATASTASTHSASSSALPPHGEGVAGDATIQKSLEDAWPADLAADDEHKLLAAGRGLLRADATGVGRAKWPALFGDPDQAIAPAFATARFRIQAAVARRDGSPDKAVVHLVWAGADRGGTYTDRRITDWYFARTSTKGASTWTPQPRI
ncbi:hypothetical protein FNV65_06025 [Streptomyces sp. S1A1-8]|uniref:hypothetical protein n=1 Tax=unclassified Streptomyces TaxID=2593676 RepID=UPI0011622505|nr:MULTISPECIES: hypothetical protein [unclassified Streptomyces]QDN95925.1 hypothetical protein FNV58_07455 [Streptomyces sp. RLB1-9]QDO17648.1 hypothetical protein FNV65_06025 [Streptomyces sp. S1A1-8]QDO27771.1 hypothetical protein FNV63_06015 [Streptomyces sp. S1A1-3]